MTPEKFEIDLVALVERYGSKLTSNEIITALEAVTEEAYEESGDGPSVRMELMTAAKFATSAALALEAYEADYGEPLPVNHEIGRIEDSRGSPSFRIQVDHIRRLAAAVAKAGGRS